MKCPNCGKSIPNTARQCRYCKVRLLRKSDHLASKMMLGRAFAHACAGIILFIGILLLVFGIPLWGGIFVGFGLLLIFLGMKIH